MKIGIVGSGNMGRTLGMRWAELGHRVFFGARTAEKGKAVADFVGRGSQGGSIAEAITFGDVLLYSLRDVAPSSLVSDPSLFDGKVLIDLNNGPIPEGFAYEAIGESFAERYQRDLPKAKVVKAFNTLAQEVFAHDPATLREQGISVFVAGGDAAAKEAVAELARDMGFTPVDSGGLRNARLLEGLGDTIRYFIAGAGLGAFATISLKTLPSADSARLGGRQSSNFS